VQFTRPSRFTFWQGCGLLAQNLAALAMAAVGGYFAFTSLLLTQSGHTVQGTVTELVESNSNEGGVSYAPVIEYQVDGQTYSFNTRNYSDPPAYHVGQQVIVLYDPARPGFGRIDNIWDLWLQPGMLCPAALILFLVSNAIGLAQIRRRRA
jgi:hypothetical protein